MDQNRAPPAFVIPDVSNIDPKKLGSIGGPEYIPYNPRGRDIYGRLSFNTGVCWVGGFAVGGTAGLVEGWRSAVNPNWKVKFNSVLNGLSKQGSRLGNGLGIIGKLI